MSENVWASEAVKHETNQKFSDVRELKFKDNHTTNIRILPNKEEGGMPFHSYVIHWIPQANSKHGKPVVHPMGEKCAICKYVNELWAEIHRLKEEEDCTDKSPEVEKIYAKISKVGGRTKYDFNILDREDLLNADKVMAPKRMSATGTVWKPILDFAKKWGSPSNETEGYDFEITTEGEGTRRKYSIAPERDASPLTPEEKKAVKRGYDLAKLRQPTSYEDFREVLSNAQSPYDELLDRLSPEGFGVESETEEKPKKTVKKVVVPEKVVEEVEVDEDDVVVEVEPVKEVKKTVKKVAPVLEPETSDDEEEEVEEKKIEPVKEVKKMVKKVEKQVDVSILDDLPDADGETPTNINNYECKGQVDSEDEGCIECPVKDHCLAFVPFFDKAKSLNISVENERSIAEIMNDVKAQEEPEVEPEVEVEQPKMLGKKKKSLPF